MAKPVRKKDGAERGPAAGGAPRVRVLDPLVSARIAAGEVIEQPASVVRELVDNALDAGARSITVELQLGGMTRIAVRDDGCGMSRDDLPLAVQKHATSKISSLEDLDTCLSLGFRGEALFAIASVARARIVSNDGNGGHELAVDNGVPEELRAAPSPRGTSIEVLNLFQKLPARLAFLKSAASETRAVRRVLVEKMLAWPGVRFVFISDGSTLINSAAGDLITRVGDLYGAELVRELLPLEHEENGITLTGYIAPPHQDSATRREQVFIINGRPLAMPLFGKALSTAYGNHLAAGRHAVAFIALTMDPAQLNVNVHPAKREVRFQAENAVFSVLVHAVRKALAGEPDADTHFAAADAEREGEPVPQDASGGLPRGAFPSAGGALARNDGGDGRFRGGLAAFLPLGAREGGTGYARGKAAAGRYSGAGAAPLHGSGISAEEIFSDASAPSLEDDAGFAGASARILGCYASNYWLYEQEDALFIVDQHAAHERVLYERFKKEYFAGGIARQALLIPISFTPLQGELEVIEEQGESIQEAGFSIAPFGKRNWIIDEYPSGVKDVPAALRSLLAALAAVPHAGLAEARDARREKVLATLACHAAVRQGDRINEAFLREILAALAALESPFTCPHGRPAIIRLGKEEVEKWFARR